jgi:ubiquitin-like domain-containing CTD phosphatase 1
MRRQSYWRCPPAADYTIFDLNSSAERPEELARPYLHAFFAATYADYDLVIWRWGRVECAQGRAMAHMASCAQAHGLLLLTTACAPPCHLPSATSMKWVEVKMRELGVSTHPDYRLTCMLDHRSMVTVQHDKHGGCWAWAGG